MSTEAWKSNSLAELAECIRATHEVVRQALKMGVENAMATGDLLIEAKAQVDHGEWSDWLHKNCEMSDRSARLYMRLAKNREVIEAYEDAADLTLNAAARLLASPKGGEKQDDLRDKAADEITVLHTQTGVHVTNLRKRLLEVRATFEDDEKFKAWLQQEFPEPTDPKEKELADMLGKTILMVAGVIPEDES